MLILLTQSNIEIREKMAFSLGGLFKAQVIEAANLTEATQKLATAGEKPDLLILDVPSLDLSDEVEIELAEFHKLAPEACCIFVTQTPTTLKKTPEWKNCANLERRQLTATLPKQIELLITKGLLTPGQSDADYCKIRTKLLLSVCPLKSDIYIRLSESKFIKLFNEGDAFEQADLEKYTLKKGIAHLYLKNEEIKEFVEKYNADIQKQLENLASLPPGQVAKQNAATFETAQEVGKRIGFTREVQVMAKTWVKTTVKSMEQTPKLSSILKQLRSFKGQYLSLHSSMTAYTSCAIATHLAWGSDTTFSKLTLAAFLHDIALTSNEMAVCKTLEDARARKFSDAEMAEIKNHPFKSAEIAQQFQEVPPDVDVIVVQHHEMADGSGFPRKLTSNYIAPLAAVFIIAHELSDYILMKGEKFVVSDFLNALGPKYRHSVFRKVLEATAKLA